MKKTVLTLALLASTLTAKSQWGIVTLEKNIDYVPMEMWYTINEKDRKNQMYFTSHDAEVAGEVLQKVLSDMDVAMEDTMGRDSEGSLFWGAELGNGFYSWIFYTDEKGFFTVAILTEEQ